MYQSHWYTHAHSTSVKLFSLLLSNCRWLQVIQDFQSEIYQIFFYLRVLLVPKTPGKENKTFLFSLLFRLVAAVRVSPCHSRQPSIISDASALEGDRSSTPSDINSPRHRTHSLCNVRAANHCTLLSNHFLWSNCRLFCCLAAVVSLRHRSGWIHVCPHSVCVKPVVVVEKVHAWQHVKCHSSFVLWSLITGLYCPLCTPSLTFLLLHLCSFTHLFIFFFALFSLSLFIHSVPRRSGGGEA